MLVHESFPGKLSALSAFIKATTFSFYVPFMREKRYVQFKQCNCHCQHASVHPLHWHGFFRVAMVEEAIIMQWPLSTQRHVLRILFTNNNVNERKWQRTSFPILLDVRRIIWWLVSLGEPPHQAWEHIGAPVSEAGWLAVTIHFLSSGISRRTLAASFKLGSATVSCSVREVCCAVWRGLWDEFAASPEGEQRVVIECDFWELWNYPNCVGAVDGEHIGVRAPANGGSSFSNYKGCFRVLFHVCEPSIATAAVVNTLINTSDQLSSPLQQNSLLAALGNALVNSDLLWCLMYIWNNEKLVRGSIAMLSQGLFHVWKRSYVLHLTRACSRVAK